MTLEERLRALIESDRRSADVDLRYGRVSINASGDLLLFINGADRKADGDEFWQETFLVQGDEAVRVHPVTWGCLTAARMKLIDAKRPVEALAAIAHESLSGLRQEIAKRPVIGLDATRDKLFREILKAETVVAWFRGFLGTKGAET